MEVPFTWKVTGWFMVGWSPEFPVGEVRPLHYFGEDQVAYRDEAGELHLMEAHCKHLGAHIGHGGKVVGDCIERLDGRKAFLTATMTDNDGTVLSEANGLMIKLLPHQP